MWLWNFDGGKHEAAKGAVVGVGCTTMGATLAITAVVEVLHPPPILVLRPTIFPPLGDNALFCVDAGVAGGVGTAAVGAASIRSGVCHNEGVGGVYNGGGDIDFKSSSNPGQEELIT